MTSGIKVGKMAFALITKAGKKFNVQKIELSNDSQLVQRTQERMREDEREKHLEKQRMKALQVKLAQQ